MNRVAKGKWQQEIEEQLLAGQTIPHPAGQLRGAAKDWQLRYDESFESLIARMRAAGHDIEVGTGPRGGRYSGQVRIRKGETVCVG